MCTSLMSKYNVAGPRYTSYPTVPYWDNDTFSLKKWKQTLKTSFNDTNTIEGISLYIHLPFCESMCTFCGCNKRITKNHSLEMPYIKSVLKELGLYKELLGDKPRIKQIHLGGGTPTFFSPENLEFLIEGIFLVGEKLSECELSFEGHPNNTTKAHLKSLHKFGFTRVCYGVQDYNTKVQKAINRIQPFEKVLSVTQMAREVGYNSVGHDIVYGLPFQNSNDICNTIQKTILTKPDRIAFYSYAHVPWIKGNGQRGFKTEDLPSPEEKKNQYELGKIMLNDAGYKEIGMDHFALKTDALYKSSKSKEIHRNFMGYSSCKTKVTLGLGVSSISDSWYSFAQNVKSIEEYYSLLENNILPVYRGHILTEEDLVIRAHILNIMCRFETSWEEAQMCFQELPLVIEMLLEMEKDGLIELSDTSLKVTAKGRPFVRNICLPFDLRLQRKKPETTLFSMTI